MAKAVMFAIAALVGGLVAGAVLGAIGGMIAPTGRVAIASVFAPVAILAATLDLIGRRLRVLQRDRETPQPWLGSGALSWAFRNGLVLGFGATSRIGFWLWYVVPVSSLLIGEPLLGAAIYGIYGLVRGLAAWWLIVVGHVLRARRGTMFNEISEWLIRRRPAATVVAAGQLLIVGITFAIAVGL